jgi:hypothetical protein
MDLVISVHTISLTSTKVFPAIVYFWSCYNSFLICSFTFFYLDRLVWKEVLIYWRFSTSFLCLLIYVSCWFIFSMDLARSVVSSGGDTGVADGIVVTIVVLYPTIGIAPNGMPSIGFIFSFSFSSLSISASISLS